MIVRHENTLSVVRDGVGIIQMGGINVEEHASIIESLFDRHAITVEMVTREECPRHHGYNSTLGLFGHGGGDGRIRSGQCAFPLRIERHCKPDLCGLDLEPVEHRLFRLGGKVVPSALVYRAIEDATHGRPYGYLA